MSSNPKDAHSLFVNIPYQADPLLAHQFFEVGLLVGGLV